MFRRYCNGVGRAVRVRLSVDDEVGDGLFQTEAKGVFGPIAEPQRGGNLIDERTDPQQSIARPIDSQAELRFGATH